MVAIPQMALRVYSAYKDAPDNYRHIGMEVESLQIIINKAERHFENASLSDKDWQQGQEVLQGCKNVLVDLNSLIKKYNSLSSASTSQVFKRVKLSVEDIATLRTRLISNTVLLHGFIQMFDIPAFTIEYTILIIQTAGVRCMRCRHG